MRSLSQDSSLEPKVTTRAARCGNIRSGKRTEPSSALEAIRIAGPQSLGFFLWTYSGDSDQLWLTCESLKSRSDSSQPYLFHALVGAEEKNRRRKLEKIERLIFEPTRGPERPKGYSKWKVVFEKSQTDILFNRNLRKWVTITLIADSLYKGWW